MKNKFIRISHVWLIGLMGIAFTGCHTDMWVQPKTGPLDESTFYGDGKSARPLPAGTVARGHLRNDDVFFSGFEADPNSPTGHKLTNTLPVPLTKSLLLRGQERFQIYCTPCHGQLGDGNGMIANRGFKLKRPVASYHTDRLRNMPVGHFYQVITNGYGAMYSYASRVEPQDRWAIAAYIRALQLSQNVAPSQLSAEDQQKLKEDLAPKSEHEEGAGH